MQTLMLARGMLEHGWKPAIFALEARGDLREEAEKAGIPVIGGGYDSRVNRLFKIWLLARGMWRLWWLLRRVQPQVVHGVLPLTNFFATVAGRLARVPMVITSRRALNTHQERVPGWLLADRLSARLSDVVVANAQAVKRDTLAREGGDPEKIEVIYNGLDFSRLQVPVGTREEIRCRLGIPAAAPVLVVVANLIPYKGHEELLQAFARVTESFPEASLLVVGEDRGIGGRLRAMARELGVHEKVHWLGLRRDVPRFLAAADIYVSASHEEGFSNAVLEALAAGKAVVATRVGGTPEMLEGGRLGLLVEPNDPGALAEALGRLLADPALREELGRRARESAKTLYAQGRMVENHLRLYRGEGLPG